MRWTSFFHHQPNFFSLFCFQASKGCLFLLFLFIPLFFLPYSLDVLEVSKQTLATILILPAVLFWIGSILLERKIIWRHQTSHLLAVLFFLTTIIAAILSQGGFLSWIGTSAQEYTSVFSFGLFFLLFLLLTQLGHEIAFVKNLLFACIFSSFLTATIGCFQLFGWFVLPFDFARTPLFNFIGSLNAFGIFLAVTCTLGNGFLLFQDREPNLISKNWMGWVENLLALFLSIFTIVSLLAIHYWILWIILLLGHTVLLFFTFIHAKEIFIHGRTFIFMLVCAISFFFLFFPSPLHINLPIETTLSTKTSWDIVQKSLKTFSSSFGSGPGTFLFDSTRFRPVELNTTSFWNVAFDRGSSHFLTLLATLGIIPCILLFFFILVLVGNTISLVAYKHSNWSIQIILLSAWTGIILSGILYPSNFTLSFLFVILAGLLSANMTEKYISVSFAKRPHIVLTIFFVFILLSIGTTTIFFVFIQRYQAEIAFTNSIRLQQKKNDTEEVLHHLDLAINLNRHNDTYHRVLAQTLLLRLKEYIESFKNKSIGEGEQTHIQSLTAASIQAAIQATELDPLNAANWHVRGIVYQELIPFIDKAEIFSITAFKQEAILAPTDPTVQTELGKTYLALAENLHPLTAAEDETIRKDTETKMYTALEQAVIAFQTALDLKKDFAPAHYELAIAFEREGRLDDAIGKMESVLQYHPEDVGAAFQLGLLYLRRGNPKDLERARQTFEHTIILVPSFSNARWFLASIYEREGNISAAIEQIQKVLELNPDDPLIKTRLNHLKIGKQETQIPAVLSSTP
ncbi:MAG: Tetratricopeptide repeat protein [Candidatus Uhrbacteria bacterium GW2011_GWF2_41_16]|uniref:Tetratricopeptide repeat protein n=2 Tax=Candidatus Uhriibacteriota TaxID=1752732 RepID=A0A0G0VDT1_9BACT|nr:MAG: Tetratricopeptide repeat protein [Candidatus Uhrbacteria bacterium GW2011_GWC2_41_11]KKR97826.1 MAG: Tetratricopeptide repeat protein [Candidatus Uhrbacteria bacterium GW2011_GWF2_41_16]HBP00510.1 hypothetical protein [Candidatus Uhrbacteria bacterium]